MFGLFTTYIVVFFKLVVETRCNASEHHAGKRLLINISI